MLTKLLIANRGQLAVRLMQTCQELGIHTVAVFSKNDRKSPHVFLADEAYSIGDGDEAYQDIEAILRVANKTGATAIHPGTGFLAENADFADVCKEQGLLFVGPSGDTLRQNLHRRNIRDVATRIGVRVVPYAYLSPDVKPPTVKEYAQHFGYPLVFKPAGGSGRGMRVVEAEKELQNTFSNEQREVFSHFGSYELILEKFLPNVRAIEVPLAIDKQQNSVIFPERDTSIQRKRRTLVDESPAPGLSAELRTELQKNSLAIAKELGFVGLASFQYLLDIETNTLYFLEMSTELGAGHATTELVTGVDLVELQLRLALGEPLPFTQNVLTPSGVALSCRLAAENPKREFSATQGTVLRLIEARGPGIRIDTGLYEGQPIPITQNPVLAQVSVHAFSRERAIQRLSRTLSYTIILGVETNLSFLADMVSMPAFAATEKNTLWVNTQMSQWAEKVPGNDGFLAVVVADALQDQRDGAYTYRVGNQVLTAQVTCQGGKQFKVTIGDKSAVVQGSFFTAGSIRVSNPMRHNEDIWADCVRADNWRGLHIHGRCYLLLREANA